MEDINKDSLLEFSSFFCSLIFSCWFEEVFAEVAWVGLQHSSMVLNRVRLCCIISANITSFRQPPIFSSCCKRGRYRTENKLMAFYKGKLTFLPNNTLIRSILVRFPVKEEIILMQIKWYQNFS